MMNILKLFKLDLKYYLLLLMPLLLVACDNSNPPAAPAPVTLTGITISPAAVPNGLPIDVTQAFTATGTYSNSSKQDITRTVTWSSSAPAMATIDANGAATGVAAGATNITASLSGKTSNTVPLTVIAPNLVSLVVTPASVPNELPTGRTQSFKAEGVFDNNKSYDVTQWVDWKSDDTAVAIIAQTGVATAVAFGTANIIAETITPPVTSNSVVLDVAISDPDFVIIEPQSFDSLPVNRKQQFVALMKFKDGSILDVTNFATWKSSNPAIATVITSTVGAGQVTGVAAGDATITATDNTTGLAKTVTVTVNDATITAVNVAPSNPDALPAGYTQRFAATGTFTDGVTRQLMERSSWAIDDTSVAILEEPGKTTDVRGLKPGVVKVSYNDLLADGKVSGKVGSSQLTVTDAILNSIVIIPNAPFSIPAGTQGAFTAMGSYSNLTSKDISAEVIWESSNMSVVVLGPGSQFTALAAGTADVTAKAQNTATPPDVISSTPPVNVTVLAATLDSLTINPTGDVIVNEARPFTVTAAFLPSGSSNYTQRVTWTSSDPAVATVSNIDPTRGVVTGVMAGNTKITATDPETKKTTSVDITVSQP